MKVVRTVADLRAGVADLRRRAGTIGFVPTMGALHDGHLSLVRLAYEDSDAVVVSIFVNPLQFVEGEDFKRYPRDMEGDLELLEGGHTDLVFIPSIDDMYPEGATTTVSVGPLGKLFEGADRPGHFDGVCTVVAKLFNLVEPDKAFFGQKDAQQVAALKRMVSDLDFDIDLIVGPIVRESSGLALSSRNAYLSVQQQDQAVALSRALRAGKRAWSESGDIGHVEKAMNEVFDDAEGVTPSYARAVDPDTFEAPHSGGRILLIVAARVGPARLIDNLLLEGTA